MVDKNRRSRFALIGLMTFGIMLVVAAALVLRPVPNVAESECLTATGQVVNIFPGGEKDICVKLNNGVIYYVNRGEERGLNAGKMHAELMGKVVTIKYPEYWTPLDPNGRTRHLSLIEYDGQVLFNECKDAENQM